MSNPDMTLSIEVSITGTDTNGTLSVTSVDYAQIASTPPSGEVAKPAGDIDLNAMAWTSDYSKATDLYFILLSSVTDGEGNHVGLSFPVPASSAVTITNDDPTDPELVPSFPYAGNSAVLMIDDQDRHSSNYGYCLEIVSQYGHSAQLDPSIVNRGN